MATEEQQRDIEENQPRWATSRRTQIFFQRQVIPYQDIDGTNMFQGMEILPYRETINSIQFRFRQALRIELDNIDRTYVLFNSENTTDNTTALMRYVQLKEKQTANPSTITMQEQTELDGIISKFIINLNADRAFNQARQLIRTACSLDELERITVNWQNGTATMATNRVSPQPNSNELQLGNSENIPTIDSENFLGYDEENDEQPAPTEQTG